MISRFWRVVSPFLYILWVCRIATIFALLASFFIYVPQARDLLLDYRPVGGIWYWALFFGAFITWYLALYVSARLAVSSNVWATSWSGRNYVSQDDFEELSNRYRTACRWVPYIIPATGSAIMVLAFLSARYAIPVSGDSTVAQGLIDHLNLSATLTAIYSAVLIFLLAAIAGFRWPMFLPYLEVRDKLGKPVARASDDRELDHVTAGFRILSFSLIGALGFGFCFLIFFPGLAVEIDRAALAFLLLGIWIPVVSGIAWLGDRVNAPVTLVIVLGLAVLSTFIFGDNHAVRAVPATDPLPDERPTIDQWIDAWSRSVGCKPDEPCDVRPILIAASGGASRAAFFTNSTLGALMDSTCKKSPCDQTKQNPFVRQVFAISSVSGSTLGAVTWATALDHAELMARNGGTDLPCKAPAVTTVSNELYKIPLHFAERMWTLTFGDPSTQESEPRFAFDNWHLWRAGRQGADGETIHLPATWQDCLEAVVAGDYLSPVLAQLLSRDVLPWPFWPDRNAALEDAFERHIAEILQPALPLGEEPDRATAESGPLSAEFLSLWRCQMRHVTKRIDETCSGTHGLKANKPMPLDGALGSESAPLWRPLVISNGASAIFGNRILASPISFDRDSKVFLDASDAHEILNRQKRNDAEPCGLPIKTAISHSARFPIVSTEGDFPHGERDEDCQSSSLGLGKNLDQTIDGGYFESIGTTTVYDLAVNLADRGYNPFILIITNDPTVDLEKDRSGNPIPEGVFGAFGTPLSGVLSARSARGAMSLEALERLSKYFPKHAVEPGEAQEQTISISKIRRETILEGQEIPPETEEFNDEKLNFAFVRVVPASSPYDDCPHLDAISMSWWLSSPTQSVLRDNVTAQHNTDELTKVCRVIRAAGHENGCQTTPPSSMAKACQ